MQPAPWELDRHHAVGSVHGADGKPRGTAFLCGERIALTAAHVVKGLADVELQFQSGIKVAASTIDEDVRLDVALLELERATLPPPLPLNDDADIAPGDRWRSYGYPIGWPEGHPVDGEISSIAGNLADVRLLILNCAQGPKPQLKGLSGGPVVDAEGSVVGVLVAYPERLPDYTLHAARFDDIWGALLELRKRLGPRWRSSGRFTAYLESQPRPGISSPAFVSFKRATGLPHHCRVYTSTPASADRSKTRHCWIVHRTRWTSFRQTPPCRSGTSCSVGIPVRERPFFCAGSPRRPHAIGETENCARAHRYLQGNTGIFFQSCLMHTN